MTALWCGSIAGKYAIRYGLLCWLWATMGVVGAVNKLQDVAQRLIDYYNRRLVFEP